MSRQAEVYRIPLTLAPQPEGGYTVTSSVMPELVTEGDTLEEALANVKDALEAAVELYRDLGKELPPEIRRYPEAEPISFEYLVPGA